MSDIYLQITETPTVVTLSAPVISGALSSTVTVANVVTVALDSNSLSALENVTVTVGAAITGTVTVGNSVTIGSLPAISGTVTVGALPSLENNTDFVTVGAQIAEGINAELGVYVRVEPSNPLPISGTVTVGNTVTIAGTVTANPTGTQTIAGTVTANVGNISGIIGGGYSNLFDLSDNGSLFVAVGPGTSQIGSVTASISNSVTIGSLPAISGTVTANTFALQGTAVTTSNFTSTTASTVLANYNATREVLTIFNEGAGNLHISPGVTCTTIAYQVRLSAGDYWEVPNHQTTITHSAVFATAGGTARVTQVS